MGCSRNCVPDVGYFCTGGIGARSVCAITCGDYIKGGN